MSDLHQIDELLSERLNYFAIMRRRELFRLHNPRKRHDRDDFGIERNYYLDPALRIPRGRYNFRPNARDKALHEARRQRFIEMHGPDLPMPPQRARDTDRDLLEPRARGPAHNDVRMGLLDQAEHDAIHQGRNELIRQVMRDLRRNQALQVQRFRDTGGNRRDPEWQQLGRNVQELRDVLRETFGIEVEEIGDILGGTRIRRNKNKQSRRRTKKKNPKRKKRN